MRTIKSLGALLLCALSASPVMAQQTYEEMEQLTVNEQVTTVITASEPVRFVDISTDKVVGDQPINNTIRLKPKEGADVHADGDVLAIVTIVTERYRTQYALIYTTRLQEAVTDKQTLPEDSLQQSICQHVHRGYGKVCPFHLELNGPHPQCQYQAASYDHALEQYL